MAEKTYEELEAEYDALKKANLERQIAEEKAKVEAAKALEEEKARKELEDEIREKVMSEFAEKSIIKKDSQKPSSMSTENRFIKATKEIETVKQVALNMRKNIVSELGAKEEDFDVSSYPGANDYEKRVAWLATGGKKRMLNKVRGG